MAHPTRHVLIADGSSSQYVVHASDRAVWTITLFGLAALGGVALQARGALLVSFEETFGVSEAALGLVTPAGTIGFVTVVVLVGLLAGRLRMRLWLVCGVAGTAIGFFLIGLAPTFGLLLGTIILRNAATGMYRALDRPILGHLYPTQRGRIFNLQTMSWAIGATIGPVLVTLVLIVGEWRHVYLLLALAFLPILIVVIWRDVPTSAGNERPFTRRDLRTIITHRELVVMGLALVFVGGIESVFFTWLPYYANQFFRPELANLTLSVYLAAYIPGRYAYSRMTVRLPYLSLATVTVLVSVIAFPLAFALAGQVAFLPAVFVLGLLVSGLFPTLLAWGVDVTPEFTGPVNAAALTSAQIGFFVFPAVVGILATQFSIEAAMLLQIGLVGALFLVLLLGRRYVSSAPGRMPPTADLP